MLLLSLVGKISLIALSCLLLFIILYVLLRVFVLNHRKARKLVLELERKYEYLHALLIGQDAQYIKRLEIISQSNLLYTQIHDDFFSRFQIILGSSDQQAQIAISLLENIIQQKKYHDFKLAFDKNKRIVDLFEAQVKELNAALVAKLKPEEECRTASLVLKEKLRTIKSSYFEKQSELMSIEDTFTRAFNGIEMQFIEHEKYVESAFYEEANALLPIIAKMVDELRYALEELPTLCMMIDTTIPNRIAELQEQYNQMKEQNIPVHHLLVNQLISSLTNELYDLQMKTSNFELKGIKEQLMNMLERMDKLTACFEEEKKAQKSFNDQCDMTYAHVNQLERQFIVLRQRLIKIKEIYRLDDLYIDRIDVLQNEVNQLGVIKRQLDTYIHSSTKQPYSTLLSKMDELSLCAKQTDENMQEYYRYIDSLRVDADFAFKLVNESYLQLKQKERAIRDLRVSSYANRLKDRFEQCYEYLNKIYEVLVVTPIDVKTVNSHVGFFQVVFQELVTEIKDQLHFADLAEKAIVAANQIRDEDGENDKILTRAERYFFDGDFEKAYTDACTILKKIPAEQN